MIAKPMTLNGRGDRFRRCKAKTIEPTREASVVALFGAERLSRDVEWPAGVSGGHSWATKYDVPDEEERQVRSRTRHGSTCSI